MPKVMSIINTFSRSPSSWHQEPCKKHVKHHGKHRHALANLIPSLTLSLTHSLLTEKPTPDLNGLVKFFISTDEINLPPELELLEFLSFFFLLSSSSVLCVILKRNCCEERKKKRKKNLSAFV